jgi:hypothetical protein
MVCNVSTGNWYRCIRYDRNANGFARTHFRRVRNFFFVRSKFFYARSIGRHGRPRLAGSLAGMIGSMVNQPVIDCKAILNAIHFGTVLASFAVSGFSLKGLQRVQLADIVRRKEEFGRMLVGE